MSLSSCALTNTRARLRPTVTRVTRPDGKILLERDGESEETSQSAPGFVVDTKPDLSVSQILPWLYLSSQDVAAGLDIIREDQSIVEKKIELLDIPEQDIRQA